MVENITLPGSYLHSLLVVQSESHEGDVWVDDSGTSCHITHDGTGLYYLRPPPLSHETVTIGNRRRIEVEYIGKNVDVVFHGYADQRIPSIDVSYVPGIG